MEENNLLIDDTLQQLTEDWENNANTIIWFAKMIKHWQLLQLPTP